MRVVDLGRQDTVASYLTLGQFVKAMASLPGERSLVLVSPGFLPIEQDAVAQESHLIDLAAQANVTISALDARGLYTTSLSASEHVVGNPQYQGEIRRQSMSRAENAMGELADGTGGNFFHNSNDLDSGLKSLAMPPECVYLLELPLDGVKQNGSYHRLKVKVDRDGLDVQARRGYFVSRPEKGKK
jgi:VWFA-related protein